MTDSHLKPLVRDEAEWRRRLSPERYAVLREKGTEPPFSGVLLNSKDPGVYRCAACGQPLFDAKTKFESGTGWPSFWAAADRDAIGLLPDTSHGLKRTEVVCGRCGSHLGHLFEDGPKPSGQRFCINSLALQLDTETPSKQA
jgi:peptide-methionine (R)-S-oxide reductase